MGVIKFSSILRAGSLFLDLMEVVLSKSSLRSYLAEFVSSFIFTFAGVGSLMSAGLLDMLMGSETTSSETRLLLVAIVHAFALSVAVFVSVHVSGGHVNPAVTFGLVAGCHISISIAVCYIAAQILGAILACVILMVVTAGQVIPTGVLAPHMTGVGGFLMEGIATFAVVYTVYAARDPNNRTHGVTGPMAIGFIYGANVALTSPFTGGFMNPARSFGPATVTGDFRNHWIYWVGPLLGGAVAGLVYESCMAGATTDQTSESISNV